MAQVLIVDDSISLRTEIRTIIEGLGHVVFEASDGMEGYDKAMSLGSSLDVIITDLSMPNLNGIQMIEKILEAGDYSRTKIYMLTTDSSQELKRKGKDLGISGWIVKPYRADVFQKIIG